VASTPVLLKALDSTTKAVSVAWAGDVAADRPTSVTVHLMDGTTTVSSIVLDDSNSWGYTFTAAKYRSDGTTPIDYTITEDHVTGYSTAYATDASTGAVTVTNTKLDGSINLDITAGQNFRIRYSSTTDSTTMILTYEPYLTNQEQSVTVYLPPFFSLAATPTAGTNYTVSVATVALPAQYYTEAEADILKASSPSLTNVTAVTLNFTASAAGTTVITFPINVNNYTALSDMMVAYGADAANIPLKVIAEAKDSSGAVLDWDIVAGTSRITDTTGSAAYGALLDTTYHRTTPLLITGGYPNSTGYYTNSPMLYQKDGIMYSLDQWHYPYSDMFIYIPAPEGVTVSPAPSTWPSNSTCDITEYVYLDTNNDGVGDKRYAKVVQTGSYEPRAINRSFYSGNDSTQDIYRYSLVTLPDMDTLLAGDVLNFGDMLTSYTYLGQRYEMVKLANIPDYTVPAYVDPIFAYGFATESGSYPNTESSRRRLQGKDSDGYQIIVKNTDYTNPTYVYEDATITIDFPYEVSPSAIRYSDSTQLIYPNNVPMYPTSVSYYVYGDPTEYTLNLSAGQMSVDFPASATHIVKAQFHFNEVLSTSTTVFTITADNEDHDVNGNPLPPEYPVAFNTSLTTASGNSTALWEGLDATKTAITRDPVYQPTDITSTQDFFLIQPPDALRFGTYLNSTDYPMGKYCTLVNANGATYGNGYYGSVDSSLWTFAMMKSDSEMKDYEDVTITITPQSAEDYKALSLMVGLGFGFTKGTIFEKIVVTVPTNKNPSGKVINVASTFADFMLDSDEYVNGPVVISFGKLTGANMQYTSSTTFGKTSTSSGEVWKNITQQYGITPSFSGERYYFYTGVENSTPVNNADIHHLVATITTNSTAKYLDGAIEPTNHTSTGTILHKALWTSTIMNGASAYSNSWNNVSHQYYQGDSITFRMTDFVYANDNIGMMYSFNHSNLLLYLEVAKGFSLQSITNHTLMEIRDLPNGNALYVYKRDPFTNYYSSSSSDGVYSWFTVSAYVHPDAPLSTAGTPLIVYGGYSWDGFANEHMTPATGSDAYYYDAPYYMLSINERPFPANWGIADAPVSGDPYGGVSYKLGFSTPTPVYINLALMDNVSIHPVVEDVVYSTQGQFFEHNKTQLDARAWKSNTTSGTIYEYEAIYDLPRAGGTINGALASGSVGSFANDFSMFLTGPVTMNPTDASGLLITYLDSAGQEVAISSSSTTAELRSVKQIKVYSTNFEPGATRLVNIPLETDYVKHGAQTQDLFAYVGAKRRYSADATLPIENMEYSYSAPAKYVFSSYTLTANVRLDNAETGYANQNLSDTASIDVYYLDENSVEQLLYSSSAGYSHTIKLNADATRITAQILPAQQSAYGFTIQNAANISEAYDSDLPRVNPSEISSLAININDLIFKTADKYNVGLYKLPTVTGSTHTLRVGQTAQATATVTGAALSTTRAAYLKTFIPESTDSSIATISATGGITAVSVGLTPYTVTTTNTLGQQPALALASDTAQGTGSIRVIPDVKVAARVFYDANYNGIYDAGETVVDNPNVYLTANIPSGSPQLAVGAYQTTDGYSYMDVPDTLQYYVNVINPGSTDILVTNAARFASASAGVTGQGVTGVYSPNADLYARAYQRYDFNNYYTLFNDPSFDQNNLTVYMDFALQTPHTVTFKAEHGDVAAISGLSGDYGIVTVDGSMIQHDTNGEPFVQQKLWHQAGLISTPSAPGTRLPFGDIVTVTPDSHYSWNTDADARNWKYVEEDTVQTEFGWYNSGMNVTKNMTFLAQPLQSEFQVTYNPNATSATGTVTDSTWYPSGATVTVLPNGYTNPYHEFTGWNTKADGTGTAYNPNQTFAITADTALFAQWNAQYRVEHYLRTASGPDYVLNAASTQLAYAKAGSSVTAAPLTFTGYQYQAGASTVTGTVIEPVVDTNGVTQLVLKLYYDPYPVLAITKTTPTTEVRAGENITYTVTITNSGLGDATKVWVLELVPYNTQYISHTVSGGSYNTASGLWNVGTVAAGANVTLTITVTVAATAANGDTVHNVAKILMQGGVSYDDPPTAEVTTPVKNPTLAIEKNADVTQVAAGENITYTVTVTNSGLAVAKGVEVGETLPANATFRSATSGTGTYNAAANLWTVGDIAPGGAATLTVVVTVSTTAADGDTVTNGVSVTKENGTAPPTPVTDEVVTLVQNPHVTIDKSTTQTEVRAGETLTYTVTVSNTGLGMAKGVSVTETLPANAVFTSATASTGAYDAATAVWTVGNLAANSQTTLTVVVKVSAAAIDGDRVTNQVAMTYIIGTTPTSPVTDEVNTPVKNPTLTIDKSTTQTEVRAGEDITYTVTVTNSGTGAAKGVEITETLPTNADYKSHSTASGTYTAATNLWAAGDIAAGATATLTIVVTVKATVADGAHVVNTVAVSKENGTPPTTPITDTVDTPVRNPILTIDKSTTQTEVRTGEDITYTVTVNNSGTGAAKGVEITETLPSNADYKSHSTAAGTYDTATGIWTAGDIAAGTSATLTIVVTVKATVADGSHVINTVAVSKENGTVPTTPITDTVDTPVRNPALRVVKSASAPDGSTLSSSGGKLTYQIQVLNNGSADAHNILVTDVVPASSTFVSANCADATYVGLDTATNTLRCEIAELAAGQSVTIFMTVNISAWTQIGTRSIRNVAKLFFQNTTVDSNAVEHKQTNTASSDVPVMGDTANAWIILAMMASLLVLAGTLTWLIMTRSKRTR